MSPVNKQRIYDVTKKKKERKKKQYSPVSNC